MNDKILDMSQFETAAVEGSAEQDSRVQTDGARYTQDDDGDMVFENGNVFVLEYSNWAEARRAQVELVRRANALPAIEAKLETEKTRNFELAMAKAEVETQLAEAVRILAELRACHNLNLPAKAIRKYGEAADAFLDKVKA